MELEIQSKMNIKAENETNNYINYSVPEHKILQFRGLCPCLTKNVHLPHVLKVRISSTFSSV